MASKTTRFENLLEAVPDALVGMDQKGVIRFVNRQSELLFGYDRDDLIGVPIDTLVAETLWQIYAQHRQDYFADPRTRSSGLDLELSGRHHNGGEFPVNVSMSHIDTGDVLLVITAAGDVARQQQAVRKAGLTTAIVEYSVDAIIGTTLEGIITSWNPAAEVAYGYSSREVIGRSISLLTPKDRPGETTVLVAKLSAGEHVQRLETDRVRKDGTVVPVSITIAPIRGEDGTVVGASVVHRDVTEQRQAVAVLERSAAVVEFSGEAIIGSTLEGIITSWNPAAEKIFGYTSEEIVGRPGRLIIPEDRAGEADAVLAKIRSGQHVGLFRSFRLRRDGAVFPVSITVAPIHDADGAIVGISAAARDVTELRKAFKTTRRMSAIVQNSNDAIISGTLDGIITNWNPAAERMYGYTGKEIIGKSASKLIPDDRVFEMQAVLTKIGAGEPVPDLETMRVRKDGTVFPASLSVSPIRDADGTVVAAVSIVRDVNENRKAFEAARSMAAIVESSHDAIIGKTLDGIITSWNPAAERMYGYSSKEVIGRSVELVIPESRTGEMGSILTKIRADDPVEHFETMGVRKDATVFPVSLTVSPIRDTGGSVLGAATIARDMTRQK